VERSVAITISPAFTAGLAIPQLAALAHPAADKKVGFVVCRPVVSKNSNIAPVIFCEISLNAPDWAALDVAHAGCVHQSTRGDGPRCQPLHVAVVTAARVLASVRPLSADCRKKVKPAVT
jgi:hypothetical protein